MSCKLVRLARAGQTGEASFVSAPSRETRVERRSWARREMGCPRRAATIRPFCPVRSGGARSWCRSRCRFANSCRVAARPPFAYPGGIPGLATGLRAAEPDPSSLPRRGGPGGGDADRREGAVCVRLRLAGWRGTRDARTGAQRGHSPVSKGGWKLLLRQIAAMPWDT